MFDKKSRITNFLIPISFALSITAMTLVVFESQNFTEKAIHVDSQNTMQGINKVTETPNKDKEEADGVAKIDEQTSINSQAISSPEINDLIKDLESVYGKSKSTIKSEKSTESKFSPGQIKFKSFIDKDDAMLELNRIRLQHKDLTTKIETSVKPYKYSGEIKFGIFGDAKTKQNAENICNKFEERGVECSVL